MIYFDSESDMESAIFQSMNDGECLPWNTSPHRVIKAERQVKLGEYGIADIVAYVECMESGETWVEVVELKNTKLRADHLSQLARYKGFFDDSEFDCARFTLVGLKTFPSGGDECYLFQSAEWADVYELTICMIEGVSFEKVSGWRPAKNGEKCDKFVARFTEKKAED